MDKIYHHTEVSELDRVSHRFGHHVLSDTFVKSWDVEIGQLSLQTVVQSDKPWKKNTRSNPVFLVGMARLQIQDSDTGMFGICNIFMDGVPPGY